ncbi:chitobiase-like isoform X1 [Littorina saxatilis]|uniref:beta-N-acetylhexosaminidase n=2 Tax=Littorina saxatilis TaxID=31220 RepID=A0AAN9GCT8_9CAEN
MMSHCSEKKAKTMDKQESRELPNLTQAELDSLAASLDIHYAVLDNLTGGQASYEASLTISNKGSTELRFANWSMFFSHIRMIEPGRLPCDEGIKLADGLHLMHINGCLFRLHPTPDFKPLGQGQALTIPFHGQYYSVARCDILPNWFLAAPDLEPRVIACTAGESLDFVAPFDTASKWKRFDYTLSSSKKKRFDFYDPFTPEVRFKRNAVEDQGTCGKRVIPMPVSLTVSENEQPVKFEGPMWTVVYDASFKQEAQYLAERIGSSILSSGSSTTPSSHAILLTKGEAPVSINNKTVTSNESYDLSVDATQHRVQICASEGPGIFWGVQTLLSLVSDGTLQSLEVKDAPRYVYRGMHVDVSRNFHSKESVMRLLEVMAMYKLNKFHFHLTDDEGWRLEIPGLEELTEVGSRRCHTTSEENSLLPLLGSGPYTTSSGSGFLSVEEYREILRFATQRHIEVIPEIDMPGHCHAAVKAMQARCSKLKAAGDPRAAEQYLLSDLSASATINSESQSVQMFSENSLNPGLPATYEFIRKVMKEIQKMHSDICPLRVFHFGGDEVPYEAWEDSPACQALIDTGEVKSFKDLMEYFVVKVAEIAAELGLEVGAWQDGIVYKFEEPFSRQKFLNKNVMVYAWKNRWETGMASDVYKLANSNYQVVLSPGTHLYFDHPQEPDPEERGLYWACRFTDTHKVFCFAPDNLFSNADVRLTGEAFSAEELKALDGAEESTPLKKPENIVGLQGQLWTELIRTKDQFDAMIYPRLLAMAERAWHKASWESRHRDDQQRKEECGRDWEEFAKALGRKELRRLDALGVQYYLPPPGARIKDDTFLEVNCQITGLPVQFSTDNGKRWTTYTQPADIREASDLITLRTCSADDKRHSRVIKLSGPSRATATQADR